ncbi:hypothetical protein P3S67_032426 [Capsicum chacoense]
MLPSRLNFVTGTYFAGIQADPDKCAGTKYQLIFSLICHEHHSLMSFILSHDTIRIPDLGMMITQSYKLQRMRVRGYVDEIGLEDIDTYCLHSVLSLEIRDCSFGAKAVGQCCKAGDNAVSLDVFLFVKLWRMFAASSEVAKG